MMMMMMVMMMVVVVMMMIGNKVWDEVGAGLLTTRAVLRTLKDRANKAAQPKTKGKKKGNSPVTETKLVEKKGSDDTDDDDDEVVELEPATTARPSMSSRVRAAITAASGAGVATAIAVVDNVSNCKR